MDSILITTGWYSDSKRWKQYQGAGRSKLTFESNWFSDYWIPQIEKFINPYYLFYVSNCEILPFFEMFEENADQWNNKYNILYATKRADKLEHRHGFHSAIMNGMQFALTEGLHFVFIEQDCFVHNLDKVIDWSLENTSKNDNKFLAYGFGQYSFQRGWAEQSLIFVPNNCIEFVIDELNKSRIHETKGLPMPERIWQVLFERYAVFFPFGYGRYEVKNWNKDGMFYKQQLTDKDISNFIKLRRDENV